MSATTVPITPPPAGWPLWRRQVLSVVRQEIWRNFAGWRSLWLLFLGFAPTFIIMMHSIHDRDHDVYRETLILAGIFQFFYLRFAIFFGSWGIVMRLIRGEVVQKTLHYPFLAPVRREVLLVGKFLSGALVSISVFSVGVASSFLLMYAHFESGRTFLSTPQAPSQLASYLLVVALACLGYGAVFLGLSLKFRNPIVPAVILLLWETINAILPVWLKRLSVTFYLQPLLPVDLPGGEGSGFYTLFTVVAEPTPPWLSVTGLLIFTALVLAFCCWRMRRFEISYSTD